MEEGEGFGLGGLVPDTSFRCEDVPNCIARDFRHVNRTEPTDTKKKKEEEDKKREEKKKKERKKERKKSRTKMDAKYQERKWGKCESYRS